MKGRPFVILDDYFVKDEFLASLHQNVDISELGIKQASNGKYYEIAEGTPFLKRLFSHKHIASGRWIRTNDVRITYSRWLYCVHMGMIFAVAAKYIAGLAVGPLVYTLGTLSSLCLFLVLSFHLVFFVTLNFKPLWFELAVVFHSPFAWASIWLLIMQGDRHETDMLDIHARAQKELQHSNHRHMPQNNHQEPWLITALDRRVGPLALLLMHVFIWYTRRTVIGIAVFERKTRASRAAYWMHRIYSVLAALAIVLVWKWYPLVSAGFDLYGYSTARQMVAGKLVREWAAERPMIPWLRLLATMLVSGGIHVVWYSFISYAYHMIVWKQYLRDGLAVWVVQDGAMCTKLV